MTCKPHTLMVFVLTLTLITIPSSAKPTRMVTDMIGRTVEVPDAVDRIITTFKPVTLCILCLGLQQQIVGIDTHSKKDPLTRTVFPAVTRITAVGSKSAGLNLETIVSLNPQLVVLYAQKDGIILADRLKKMGIPAIIIRPESMEKIRLSLETIARAAGLPQGASRVTQAMDRALSLVENRTRSIQQAHKKTAYFAGSRNFFNTTAGDMLQHDILERAGLVNVSRKLRGYFHDISPEQFLVWNPEMIFLSRNLDNHALKVVANPSLQRVRAIENDAVYRFPSSVAPWDFPSPLSALSTLWVAKRAYPDLFSDVDIIQYADDFHQHLFNHSLTQMGGALDDTVSREYYH